MHLIAYFDEKGNRRPAKDWAEVKESVCDNWDSCEPCTYRGGHSRTHGGFDCNHPLRQKEEAHNG